MDTVKEEILTYMLGHAAFDGWTDIALEKSATDAGKDPKYAYIAFPQGTADIAEYFAKVMDTRMLSELATQDLANMRIRDRIATAVITRLQLYTPHREAVRSLVAFHALPAHAAQGAAIISRTVSQMWYAAGDTAADFNYYTKRFLLAGVWTSTLLYWLNDESEDFADTRDFLRRRIENVMQIQKTKGKLMEGWEKVSRSFGI